MSDLTLAEMVDLSNTYRNVMGTRRPQNWETVKREVEQDIEQMGQAVNDRQVGMSYALGLGYGVAHMEPEEIESDEPEEGDMADIRNYEDLYPACKFYLDIIEVMDALHEGKKVQCEEWRDDEWIQLDKREDIVDEHGNEVGGSTLIMNRGFNWRIVK